MTKEETFVLIGLKDSESKTIARSITNDTCRSILDFLGHKKESTEGKIAKKLGIPISTVHYNLKQLKKSGLVIAKQFRWSEKGKRVLIYTLAKKLIIIAPESTYGFKEKLKSVLPTVFVGALATSMVYWLTNRKEQLFDVGIDVAEDTISVVPLGQQSFLTGIVQEPAFYFLIGMVTLAVIYWLIKKTVKKTTTQ
jgi:DNA-binding transcriptional ArsR family regulator|tara:strand:+ start:652 stop:1236 length:585 start_codon:yes stop_codon:yes gene_type:complete